MASTWIALIAASLAGGCVVAPIAPPEPAPAAIPAEPEPMPGPAETATEAPPPEAPAARPAPAPEPTAPQRVLVLLPSESATFATVLPELEAQLSRRNLVASHATLDAPGGAEAVLDDGRADVVIAVGNAATRAALEWHGAKVVFCQVSDFDFEAPASAVGVASLPPLDLQLKAWKRLDPKLRTIGLVLGRDETLLATRARDAAAALGLGLELRLASSDQEAVYHFKRMAADVDGLWLLPDNAVLSPRAIREMLDHAGARNVQTLVFTPSLLEWGALISVASTDLDLARTLADVAGAVADGRTADLPSITPLSELEARVNVVAAERLGLRPARDLWIERSVTP